MPIPFSSICLNRAHPLARGLVSFHVCIPTLSSGALTWYDLVNGYDVTFTSLPAGYGFQQIYRAGGLGVAVKRDGVLAHSVKRTASVPISGFPVTLACWFNPTVGTSEYGLMGLDDGTASNQIAMELFSSKVGTVINGGGGQVETTTTIGGSGTWNFATCTFAQGVQLAYLNGAGKSSAGSVASTPTGLNTYRIGSNIFFGTTLNGYVDGAMVYNRVLADSEVAALYRETSRGSPNLLRRMRAKRFAKATAPVSHGGGMSGLSGLSGLSGIFG